MFLPDFVNGFVCLSVCLTEQELATDSSVVRHVAVAAINRNVPTLILRALIVRGLIIRGAIILPRVIGPLVILLIGPASVLVTTMSIAVVDLAEG